MPELPEVETIRRSLESGVSGQTINRVRCSLPRVLQGATPRQFAARLAGCSISTPRRRGKYLVLPCGVWTLIIHLGMTGQLTLVCRGDTPGENYYTSPSGARFLRGPHSPDRHTHCIFTFKSGDRLLFRDVRTFGKLFLLPSDQLEEFPRLSRLGPEPLSTSPSRLYALLPRGSSRAVKTVLLDQRSIAGVGNIYADEALFAASVHPGLPAKALSEAQWKTLIRSLRMVLRRGIRNAGTTFSDYRQIDGSTGRNREKLLVYGRAGDACRACGRRLSRSVIGGRSSVWCGNCQPSQGRL